MYMYGTKPAYSSVKWELKIQNIRDNNYKNKNKKLL